MITQKNEDTGIPDFLRRNKDGSFAVSPTKTKKKAKVQTEAQSYVMKMHAPSVSIEDQILNGMEPAMKSALETEMKAGRFPRHWLLERDTLALFEQSLVEKKAKKEEGLARLRALKGTAEPKPAKPAFGIGVYIKALSPNPRKIGTRAFNAFAEMTLFVVKNPGVSVDVVLEKTSYRRDDYAWDLARGSIKTDVAAPTKVEVLAAPKQEPKPAKKAEPKKVETKKKPASKPAKKVEAKKVSAKKKPAKKSKR